MNHYYNDSISSFLQKSKNEIFGDINFSDEFSSKPFQKNAWDAQINILKSILIGLEGIIIFEFAIPRMGKRVDTILIINSVVFVIEFKVGERNFHSYDYEQVWDYALDLKNFHKPSHEALLVPILVATESPDSHIEILETSHNDNLLIPIRTNKDDLLKVINTVLQYYKDNFIIDDKNYSEGVYAPTPTIIEAALSLYNSHSVEEITRSDASALNLSKTSNAISEVIKYAKVEKKKAICFVTGVPGAGKTLVGLKVATTHMDNEHGNKSVYLSGNAPLVAILQEALARDKVQREKENGNRITKKIAKQAVTTFIQIIHHYRDAYLKDKTAPYDHVAIFDEAQRAWNKEQTVKFMKQRKNIHDFEFSEPEFLISCLDRHDEWAVIICLVGGGQEINTGEAGISEWLNAINNRYPDWEVHISSNLLDSEYSAGESIKNLESKSSINYNPDLHLAVSMRSFRAENLSLLVKKILELELETAKDIYLKIKENYSIVLTRDLSKAKNWLKEKARGSERYGLVASSQAQRLKPFAIDVKSPMNPINWFLDGKDDIRSSYFLEVVATEFQMQGLELDWVCVNWDGDLRYTKGGWKTFSFKGNKWQNLKNEERKKYLINAYRVLLTRARQGMIIFIPEGNPEDLTRKSEFYDSTYKYLKEIGFEAI